jgi:hypothetical protein
MVPDEVLTHLTKFLEAAPVQRLCRSYCTEPRDALGELYVGLIHLANGKQIRMPAVWVLRNGMGLLRNWLRREVRTLV